jgi:hypothetical protein
MSRQENDTIASATSETVQDILEGATDWQDALESLLSCDTLEVSQELAADMVEEFFFSEK